jgi:2-iminobutanoate/2-iminopropanoate deaminase
MSAIKSSVVSEIDPGWSWDDKFPLSQGVKAGNLLYISGQVALDANGNLEGKGDIRAQSRKVLQNIETVLKKAGGTMDNLIKITAYLTDMKLFQGYNEIRAEIFKAHRPASTSVEVAGLAFDGLLIEIDAVAFIS